MSLIPRWLRIDTDVEFSRTRAKRINTENVHDGKLNMQRHMMNPPGLIGKFWLDIFPLRCFVTGTLLILMVLWKEQKKISSKRDVHSAEKINKSTNSINVFLAPRFFAQSKITQFVWYWALISIYLFKKWMLNTYNLKVNKPRSHVSSYLFGTETWRLGMRKSSFDKLT